MWSWRGLSGSKFSSNYKSTNNTNFNTGLRMKNHAIGPVLYSEQWGFVDEGGPCFVSSVSPFRPRIRNTYPLTAQNISTYFCNDHPSTIALAKYETSPDTTLVVLFVFLAKRDLQVIIRKRTVRSLQQPKRILRRL